jgi:hypothetical protein
MPLPRINTPGREKGDGFPGGIKPLKRQCEAERFCGKAQERKGRRKRRPDHPGGEKALKGEAHERWRLKEISKGVGAERHVKRVAKPSRRDFPRAGQSFRDAGSKGSAQKRAPTSGYAVGPRSLREVPVEHGLRST